MAADDDQRVAAFSAQLRQAHQSLRDQLAGLRSELGRGGGIRGRDPGSGRVSLAIMVVMVHGLRLSGYDRIEEQA